MEHNEFVTVLTSSFVAEAEGARLVLIAEGLDAVIADANTVNVNWLWGPALGFIKVQVPMAQVEAAKAILKEHQASVRDEGEEGEDAPGKCLACGSPMEEDAVSCAKCGWTFDVKEEDEEEVDPV